MPTDVGAFDRLEGRRRLLAERREARGAPDTDETDPKPRRKRSNFANLDALGDLATIFPPAGIVIILALPLIAVAALLERNR